MSVHWIPVAYPFDGPQSNQLLPCNRIPSLALRGRTPDPSIVAVVAIVLVRILDELKTVVCGIKLSTGQNDYVTEWYCGILTSFQRRIVDLVAKGGFSVVFPEKGLVGGFA